jgi:hypothetical protein
MFVYKNQHMVKNEYGTIVQGSAPTCDVGSRIHYEKGEMPVDGFETAENLIILIWTRGGSSRTRCELERTFSSLRNWHLRYSA